MIRRPRLPGAARVIGRFFSNAFHANLTGQSAMVAYNLLLSILPLALLALFIASRVLQSGALEESIERDLRHLFPGVADSTISSVLTQIRSGSTKTGVLALVASVWIGSSFWGALDTAFCRIYELPCRGWFRQKRFALVMLVVVLLFMAATVAVPTLQSILFKSARGLPFGLAHVRAVVFVLSLAVGIVLLFGTLCLIYRTVPSTRVPWRAVWPGALGATIAISVVDYAFPFYLSNISTIARFGTTLVFILIVLLWFYVIAIILLGGATVNAMRLPRGPEAEPAEPSR